MSFEALTNRGEYLSPYFVEEVLPGEIRKSIATRWAERERAAAAERPDAAGRGTPMLVEPPFAPDLTTDPEPASTPMLVEPVAGVPTVIEHPDPGSGPDTGSEPPAFTPAVTPRAGLRALRQRYYASKSDLLALDADNDVDKRTELLCRLHDVVLAGLSFPPRRHTHTVVHAGVEVAVPLAAEVSGVWAVECGWAFETDAALDPAGAGRLLDPVVLGPRETVTHGMRLASHLFAAEDPPRYVLLLAGGVVILADRRTWGEGRYLAVSLDVAFGRNDAKPGGELDVIAALFGADALCPPESGGAEPLADLVAGSRRQAVGVTAELRDGLRESVELIANEVLARFAEAGVRPEEIDDLKSLGQRLTREALRYLYRILVLLYAEAHPELGVLPVDHPEYAEGYSLARLGDLVSRRPPTSPTARNGTHMFDSLDLLFRVVNDGYRARGGADLPSASPAVDASAFDSARLRAGKATSKVSEREGIRFEPLRSDLFDPQAITLITAAWSGGEDDDGDPDEDQLALAGRTGKVDTRLRNAVLYRVLRRLMVTKGGRKARGGDRRQGGFISYAQLGINQLGAVYEGLMSYTGFIAGEDLYEVAKGGDPKDGSWTVPASRADEYPAEVFVHEVDEDGHRSDRRRRYPAGSFVYRLSGRDRQTSASYYTPQSLTEVTVQLALKYRIEEAGPDFKARDMLDWTICEPALGSGAFLNEAINQVAAEYLRRRQEEKQKDGTLDAPLDPERYAVELQKTKAYIALHNSYGVDLNATAIELADVSLWLNVMHSGLQAPWFGLHLRRGNSLVGAGRRYYTQDVLADRSWLTTAPVDHPFRDGELPTGAIHHFLLPAAGWGAVAAEKEAKELAPDDAKRLAAWRRAITKAPTTKKSKGKASQAGKLAALTRRAEYLWTLVQQRLALSEAEIRRQIDVWGAENLPEVRELVDRQKIKDDLEAPGTPYWRLKKLMDTWCALWFWPVDGASLLDGTAPEYQHEPLTIMSAARVTSPPTPDPEPAPSPEPTTPRTWETASIFSEDGAVADDALVVTKTDVAASQTQKASRPVPMPVERLRGPVPLANLDDWIRFATALIGTEDVEQGTFVAHFTSLDELETHEEDLASWLGQEAWPHLTDRFPWLDTVDEIAKHQGFFHWEVEFAQVFSNRGGFDLQVGNPPWFRPRWDEGGVLAEFDPWFKLEEKRDMNIWTGRRTAQINQSDARQSFLTEIARNSGITAILSTVANYPLLKGTQADLYRAFMIRTWTGAAKNGTIGMLHQDSHFTGVKEGALRAASYRRLRIHGHFVNVANWAFEANRSIEFGLHIYGPKRTIDFLHASRLYSAETLAGSLTHSGDGTLPTQRHNGSWDLRPHRARLLHINSSRLAEWRRLLNLEAANLDETPLLYPITEGEQSAISSLASYRTRIRSFAPNVSRGYDESLSKRSGLIQYGSTTSKVVNNLILQGPHIGIATPFGKSPRVPCLTRSDWDTVDLTKLPSEPQIRTNYKAADSHTVDREGSYRLIWRSMIATDTERSLFAAIVPPGVRHVHALHSMRLPNHRLLALNAGFWAALPLDYLLRITGRAHLQADGSLAMLAPTSNHPLAHPLIIRTLRLNCISVAYADIWNELHNPELDPIESWAVEWPEMRSIATGENTWKWETPLRTEFERRAALVEIDALVATWLGIAADDLVAVYRSRYNTLAERDNEMYFDTCGRRIARDPYAFGVGQTKEDWAELQQHLEDPKHKLPPAGYVGPFYKADREAEMRAAHAVFSARLQAARDAGWRETDEDSAGPEAVRSIDATPVAGSESAG